MKKHLDTCPSCCCSLEITRYTCPDCAVSIDGHFSGCNFCHLSDDDRLFALIFLQTEGNMKDVERLLGISYPTVKARLSKLNVALSQDMENLRIAVKAPQPSQSPQTQSGPVHKDPDINSRIIDQLQAGEITPQEAASLIRGSDEGGRSKQRPYNDPSSMPHE
jgi:hypothetical protein